MYDEITIDARAYRSGIGVYTANLIRELHDTFQYSVHALTSLEKRSFFEPICARTSVVDAPMYSLQEQLAVPRTLQQAGLLHVPHYNFPVLYRGPLLVTIHDLTHLLDRHYKHAWKSLAYAAPMLRMSARRAQHIFTVSEYSKNKIVKHLRVDPDKVSVIHNAPAAEFAPGDREEARREVARRFGVVAPFILYVGNLKPHKNVEALMRAYHELLGRRIEVELVLVGSDQSGVHALARLAEELAIAPRLIANASNEGLAQLYRASEVFVLPSFEEGFGLTVLEAMACGTPVICSGQASLPEVAGDAACYFNPADFHELTDTLEKVLQTPSLQASLRTKGIMRARQFTWTESARRHLNVYRRFA